MKVIIDASAISSFLLEEGSQDKIRELLIKGTFATELVVTECCNAILVALRRGRITETQAQDTIGVLVSFVDNNIKIVREEDRLLREAFRIAKTNNLKVYDSIYIALSKQLHGSLASLDQRQMEVAKRSSIKLESI